MKDDRFKIIDKSGDRKYFTIVPNYIVNHSTIYEQAIYLYMKRVAGEEGSCWESPKNIAKKLGIAPGTVRKYQKELVKRGAKITALVHSNDIKNLYPIKDKIKIITAFWLD